MTRNNLKIHHIPATLWGAESQNLFIAVHGNLSHKEDVVIHLLADIAEQRGYQVLSFDLPEHGERRGDDTPCKVQICIQDLMEILDYTKDRWRNISLFACSMGAYFSLMAYQNVPFKKVLFLSPVVDMERIIRNMMTWFQVTPEILKEAGTMDTPIGQKLYWDYFCYVRDHPVERWDPDTSILYGGKDNLCEFETISDFTKKFTCSLEIVDAGEHYFHTHDQLQIFSRWLSDNIT